MRTFKIVWQKPWASSLGKSINLIELEDGKIHIVDEYGCDYNHDGYEDYAEAMGDLEQVYIIEEYLTT